MNDITRSVCELLMKEKTSPQDVENILSLLETSKNAKERGLEHLVIDMGYAKHRSHNTTRSLAVQAH